MQSRIMGCRDPWGPTSREVGLGQIEALLPVATSVLGSLLGGQSKGDAKKEEYKSRARSAEASIATLRPQLTEAQATITATQAQLDQEKASKKNLILYGGVAATAVVLAMLFLRR